MGWTHFDTLGVTACKAESRVPHFESEDAGLAVGHMGSSSLDKQELKSAGSLDVEKNSTDVANPAAGQCPAPASVTWLLQVTMFQVNGAPSVVATTIERLPGRKSAEWSKLSRYGDT